MTVNIQLLRETVEYAETRTFSNGETEMEHSVEKALYGYIVQQNPNFAHFTGNGVYRTTDKTMRSVTDDAARMLGVNHFNSAKLFNPLNDTKKIRDIAETLAGQKL